MFGALLGAGIVAGLVASYSRNLPDINRMADYQPSRSTRVFARDGSQLANLYTENRIWVPIAQIPVPVRNAFIATEDQHFYQHHGVDFGGILRAGIADWRHEQFQGASTITQQLARRLFLSGQVSIARKVQEALLAIEIERYYTKDEILERYLNIIYFGSGAYGIQAAAHTYFGTDVGRLTIGQAAMLAGLPAAPSDYSPFASLERARNQGTARPTGCFGAVANPIQMMTQEHDAAGTLLARIRRLSGNFTPPAHACPTFHAFCAGLREFEQDLHRHIHLENNILFPRAIELELASA